jgi:hypothetical protein
MKHCSRLGEVMADTSVLRVKIDASGMQGQAKQAERSLDGIGNAAGRTSSALAGIGKYMSIAAGLGTLGKVIQISREFETLRSRLVTVTGSVQNGTAAFAALQTMAARTPYSVQEITDAYVRLRAQGIAPTEALMESMGNTSAAMGKSIVQFAEAILDAQTGEFERLKEFGVKARDEGSKVAFTFKGVTTSVSKDAGSIVGYLEKIGNTDFAGAMDRQSKTLGGAFSNLQDASAGLADTIGSNGLARELGLLARQITETAGETDGAARRIGQGLGYVVGVIGMIPEAFVFAAAASEHALGQIEQAIALVAHSYFALLSAALEAGSGVAKALGFERLVEGAREQLDEILDSTKRWAQEGAAIAEDGAKRAADSLLILQERWEALQERTQLAATANKGAGKTLAELAEEARQNAIKAALSAQEIAKLRAQFERLRGTLDPVGDALRDHNQNLILIQSQSGSAAEATQLLALENERYKNALLDLQPIMDAHVQLWQEVSEASAAAQSEMTSHVDLFYDLAASASAAERDLEFQLTWALNYGEALGGGAVALRNFAIEYALAQEKMRNPLVDEAAFRANMGAIIDADKANDAKEKLNSISADFTENLASGMAGAVASFAREFIETGEFNVKKLGDMLLDVLLDAAQAYFVQMVANQAKLKMAEGATGTSGSSGWASLFGGAGGMSGGAMSGLAFAAFAAGLIAVFKHQSDRHTAVQYGTTAGTVVNDGSIQTGMTGKLYETGTHVSQAIASLLGAFQSASGVFIEGTAIAEIQIRNDKERFRAVVNGVLIGEFRDLNEAIIAAAKSAFLNADLSGELDPILQGIIQGFKGNDPAKLVELISAVRGIMDEVSGLTEIEIALRDLPQRAAALASELMGMGVAFEDANQLAGDWQARQMQTLRDQITGHQQTAAEELAERKRQAAMFNAQVTLLRAETQLKRDEIAARVAYLEATGQLYEGQAELQAAELQWGSTYLIGKNDIYSQDVQLQAWYLQTMGAATQASLATLQLQLAALDQMLENIPGIIGEGEIRINRPRGGGRVNTGPSEREQRALDFAAFLDEQMANSLSDLQRRLYDLNETFDAQAQAASEVEGGEARLLAARLAALAQLNEELIDGLGLPMESLRDRFAALTETILYLRDQSQAAMYGIRDGVEGSAAAYAHFQEVLTEFRNQMTSELLNLALYFTDAMGDTEESARIRKELAEMEWDFKRAEMRLTIATLEAIGGITAEAAKHWNEFLDGLSENLPDVPGAVVPEEQNDNGMADALEAERKRREQALISALDRLRNALDKYKEFREDLATGPLSGDTLQQRTAAMRGQYEAMLAAAQGGNIEAIENLPGMARDYLELLGQFIDPSSSQYQAIKEMILGQLGGIEGAIEGLLGGRPSQNEGVETRLDTIAEIMREWVALWGGNPTWNPGGGVGSISPFGRRSGFGYSPSGQQGIDGTAGEVRVRDEVAREEGRRTNLALAQVQAKLDAGFSKVAGATNRQTDKAELRALRAPSSSRIFGDSEGDRMAS